MNQEGQWALEEVIKTCKINLMCFCHMSSCIDHHHIHMISYMCHNHHIHHNYHTYSHIVYHHLSIFDEQKHTHFTANLLSISIPPMPWHARPHAPRRYGWRQRPPSSTFQPFFFGAKNDVLVPFGGGCFLMETSTSTSGK